MKILNIQPQDIDRWTDGWVVYSLYGIVVVAILIFVINKFKKGKERKRQNERIRQEKIENRKEE